MTRAKVHLKRRTVRHELHRHGSSICTYRIDTKGNFIFRRKSRRLCQPPFCRKDHSNNIKDCSTYCEDVNLILASKTCSKLTPVIKIIRLAEFDILNGFNIDGEYDPKFIFLVRDPRQAYNMPHIELINFWLLG